MDIEQAFAALLLLGAMAVVTSIVAGSVKLFNLLEVEHPLGPAQRWPLGIVGVLMAVGGLAGLLWIRDDKPGPGPPAPSTSTTSAGTTTPPPVTPTGTTAPPSSPSADCSDPQVTATPRSGSPGTSVTVSGSGFPAGDVIRVSMYGESWNEPTLTEDDGTFTVVIRITDHWGGFTPMESFVHASSSPQGCSAQTSFLITQQ